MFNVKTLVLVIIVLVIGAKFSGQINGLLGRVGL